MTQELKIRAVAIRKKILTMEWDLSQGQLHEAKVARINNYKKQLEELEAEIEGKPAPTVSTVDQ